MIFWGIFGVMCCLYFIRVIYILDRYTNMCVDIKSKMHTEILLSIKNGIVYTKYIPQELPVYFALRLKDPTVKTMMKYINNILDKELMEIDESKWQTVHWFRYIEKDLYSEV